MPHPNTYKLKTKTDMNEEAFNRRAHLESLKTQLETDRSSFKYQWRDINDYIRPRRGRFFVTDANRGDRRNLKIIDSTATFASANLAAGMMSGASSPARPWFGLGAFDPADDHREDAKEWFHTVTTRMKSAFLRSNYYNILPITLRDMGDFATGCMFMDEDIESIARFYSFPIGSYCISSNQKGQVDVFIREFQMTVRQIVEMFGRNLENPSEIDWTNISKSVQSLWNQGHKESWIIVVHAVMPNENYKIDSLESRYKRYSSIYYERGDAGGTSSQPTGYTAPTDKLLSEKGYDYFPVLVPRWGVTGEDVYGTDSPGMTVIGDIKQLQKGEKKSLMAIDKQVDPPMNAPESMKTKRSSILPGDITYLSAAEQQQGGFVPTYQLQFDHIGIENKNEQVRQRIKIAYHEPLFLNIINSSSTTQRTAREIDERHEEKILGLGPTLWRLHDDVFDPLIDNMFILMNNRGMIPPAPEWLVGQELKVQYVSILAESMKLAGISNIDRFAQFAAGVASVDAEALDKVNRDKLIEVYGDLTSVPPGVINSDEETQAIRQQRQQQMAQQQQMEQANMAAQTAKQLSDTNTTDKNALTDLVGGGQGQAA